MILYQSKDDKMIFGIPSKIYTLSDKEVVEQLKVYQEKDKTQLSHRISNISYVNKRLLYEVQKGFDRESLNTIKENIIRAQRTCTLIRHDADKILFESIYTDAKTCLHNGKKLLNTIDNDFITKPLWYKRQSNMILQDVFNIMRQYKAKEKELEKTKCQQ